VFLVRGRVMAGVGNGGNTHGTAFSTTIGHWELLQGVNGVSPANEIIVYSASQGFTDFYIDLATVTPL
jgi:hypothetical protein